jgi:NlpC/P60 family putative phage cell wall peptidase
MSGVTDGRHVVTLARRWIGTPYRHQASIEGVGCDCLGLVRGVWREGVGPEPITMPAYSARWRDPVGGPDLLDAATRFFVPAGASDAPGTLVLFRMLPGHPPKHCAILTAADRFVHALEGAGVVEVSLNDWWRRRIAARFHFPEEG